MSQPRFGVHLSLGRDARLSMTESNQRGARCAQIFASSPGAWKAPLWDGERSNTVRTVADELDLRPLVIHAIYLINLASANPLLLARSCESLIATLRAGATFDALGIVTHIGSHGGRGFEAVADQIANALQDILQATPPEVDLLLENSAGAGGIIGSSLSEIGELLRRAGNPPRLKVALDTAHLCASGWDFRQPGVARKLVEETAGEIGLDRLALLHANDSLVPVGSRRDRHANVGEGAIGHDGFRALLDQPELRAVPWILETPDLGLPRDDAARFGSLRVLSDLSREGTTVRAGTEG